MVLMKLVSEVLESYHAALCKTNPSIAKVKALRPNGFYVKTLQPTFKISPRTILRVKLYFFLPFLVKRDKLN